jgi:hypothetical protein
MRELYRDDRDVERAMKMRFKDLDKMSEKEINAAFGDLCIMSRAYIKLITKKFLDRFQEKDRFQMAAKQGIINTMPTEYNEAFLKRVDRLCKMAESRKYVVNFSKWRTTDEYGWFFVRTKIK